MLQRNSNALESNIKTCLLFSIVPVIIYFYFYNWHTVSVYGDDLYIFNNYSSLTSYLDKINITVSSGKYRPVNGFFTDLIIGWFQKDVHSYYIFNVVVQTAITFVFCFLINLFVPSIRLSLLSGLVISLSRFSYYNISQLFNGGALEGMAMLFFLCSVYFLLRPVKRNNLNKTDVLWSVIYAILFANISMYSHERYIVIFPFLLVGLLMLSSFNVLSLRSKAVLIISMIVSVFLNIYIKKSVYNLDFAMGTGGAKIEFSFTSAFSFFIDGLLSLFQINSGPHYLTGIPFSDLSLGSKLLAILVALSSFIILIIYLLNVFKVYRKTRQVTELNFLPFLLVLGMGLLLLLPAVVTIRLEQRWLQGTFSMLLLLIGIAFFNIPFLKAKKRYFLFPTLVCLIILIDSVYFVKGVNNMSLYDSNVISNKIQKGINNGIIKPSTENIYIWEVKRDVNSESALKWIMADGKIFDFYQGKSKNIYFIDSAFSRNYDFPMSTIGNLDLERDQVVYLGGEILDITHQLLAEPQMILTPDKVAMLEKANQLGYNPENLSVTIKDMDKFTIAGFYEPENNFRWTNGDAGIEFLADYVKRDSFSVKLETFLPEVCKDIEPEVIIFDETDKQYLPFSTFKDGNFFNYKYFIDHSIKVKKIVMKSKVVGTFSDQRTLSFPFVSLTLK